MSTGGLLSTVFKHEIHEIHEKDERVFKAADTAAIQWVGGGFLRKRFVEASAASDKRAGMRRATRENLTRSRGGAENVREILKNSLRSLRSLRLKK